MAPCRWHREPLEGTEGIRDKPVNGTRLGWICRTKSDLKQHQQHRAAKSCVYLLSAHKWSLVRILPLWLSRSLFFGKCVTQSSCCHSAWLPSHCRCKKKKNSCLPVQNFKNWERRKPTHFKKHFLHHEKQKRHKTNFFWSFFAKNLRFLLAWNIWRVKLNWSGGLNFHKRIKWTSNPIIYLICASAHGEERQSRYLSPLPQSLTD